jgi:hypothetical protein
MPVNGVDTRNEDGPEAISKAVPKAAGEHVVIGTGSAR